MRRLAACAGALLAALTVTVPAASGQAVPRQLAALQRALAGQLQRAGGRGGALVEDLNSGQVLYAAAPTVPRLPASVEKLWTTSSALLRFGPTARLTTSLLGVGSLTPGGVWHGTLYLRGGGDPTFGSQAFDTANYGPGTGATVQQLAAALARAGVRRVAGAIVGDESYFDSLRGQPDTGFRASLEVEGELSALAYDDGFATAAEDSLQPRPALWAGQELAAALPAAGIRVAPGTHVYTGTTPAGATPLASISSPPVATLIRLTNAPSDNFFAETLLKDLGAHFATGGSTAAGAAVVRTTIAQAYGLRPQLNDGSGLSRYDRTSPQQVVALLAKLATNGPFTASLAVAGISGTMKDEMRGTRAAGNCRGKTGTLRDVANLVGYCTARNGDLLAFAFMLNSLGDPTFAHAVEDAMGVALANYNAPRAPYAPAP